MRIRPPQRWLRIGAAAALVLGVLAAFGAAQTTPRYNPLFPPKGAPQPGTQAATAPHGQGGLLSDAGARSGVAAPPAGQAPSPVAAHAPQGARPHFERRPNEHPLAPALRWAYAGLRDLERVEDYSCTLVKRERVGDELLDHQYMFLKVRHRPFSVYVYFTAPDDLRGREAIYVHGRNDGKMWAHTTGFQDRLVGTLSLEPTGALAMRGNRYPITEIGLLNLVRKLIEVGEHDAQFGECDVRVFSGARVNDRVCTCLQVVHPVPRKEFRYHKALIYVDDQLNVPIRFEAYGWPERPGEPPPLLEEYTYLNLQFNNGFTDRDFDIRNPDYNFR
jgi:hypothetical protein